MRRMPRSSWNGWRRARSCTARAASNGRSFTRACRRSGRSRVALRCAREVEQALRKDAAGFLEDMYGNEPDRWTPELEGAERLRFTVNCLTRLRLVDRKGRLVLSHKGTVEDAPAGTLPWFRHPERATRDDAFVFGHWSALGYLAEPGLRCLDTGCVWGGALTALRLDREEEPVSLPCGKPERAGD